MEDEHAWVGSTFQHDMVKKDSSLFGSCVGSKGLCNGIDIIVNCLGHANNHNLSTVLFQNVLRELCSLGVGVVSSNGVQHIDLVLKELLGSNFQRCLVVFAKAAGDAVFNVGEL